MTRHLTPIVPPGRTKWRDRQADLIKTERRKRNLRALVRLGVFGLLFIFAVYGLFNWLFVHDDGSDSTPTKVTDAGRSVNLPFEDPAYVRQLIKERPLINLPDDRIHMTREGKTITIDTSIDIPLQNHLLKKMDRTNSRYIGVVALEASTGRVLAMAGFDRKDSQHNICLDNRFPAASIFKIVTAAAAVEELGLGSNSTLSFNGAQHTLYKSQLKERTNKYTNHISLRDSFAKSVNPVFGKIGSLKLGKASLQKYAEAFGFNTTIAFEKPPVPSRFTISDDPYNWAEIASGFNRETTMSPLHGALMAALILNEGKRIEPSIVEAITLESGEPLFPQRPRPAEQVISPTASRVVYDLMEATVRYGTCSKAFRGYRKDPVLSKLNIGGKTGSIFNKSRELRIDWFVGFADVKNGRAQMALAVVVAHEKYIGIRASQYARMAITKYFTDFFKEEAAKVHAELSG